MEYDDDVRSPSSPEFSTKKKRGPKAKPKPKGGKRGRKKGQTKAQMAKAKKEAAEAAAAAAGPKVEPLKIKLSSASTKQGVVIGKPGSQAPGSSLYGGRFVPNCFVEKCNRNPFATLFKMPQMTKSKLRDWIRYVYLD